MRLTLVVGQNGELMGHLIAIGYTMVLMVVTQWFATGHTMGHHRSYNGPPLMSQ